MLIDLNNSFSLIGLTETKYKVLKESLFSHIIPGIHLFLNKVYEMLVEWVFLSQIS